MRSAELLIKRPAASRASRPPRPDVGARRPVALVERWLLFKLDRPRAIDRWIDYFGAPAREAASW